MQKNPIVNTYKQIVSIHKQIERSLIGKESITARRILKNTKTYKTRLASIILMLKSISNKSEDKELFEEAISMDENLVTGIQNMNAIYRPNTKPKKAKK